MPHCDYIAIMQPCYLATATIIWATTRTFTGGRGPWPSLITATEKLTTSRETLNRDKNQ